MDWMEVLNFILANWQLLVAIGTFIVTGITTLVTLIKTKNWNKLWKFAQECMAEAELFAHYTGAEKKAYVMTKLANFAKSRGIAFNINKVSAAIDAFVALTKQINYKAKSTISAK